MKIFLLIAYLSIANCFILPTKTSSSTTILNDISATLEPSKTELELVGSTLQCTFTGFGVSGMNAFITLGANSEAKFSGGIESLTPGYWRVVENDEKPLIEITQPVRPEYLLFFDIWEKSILWKGNIDKNTKTIDNGEVSTNKKWAGIFPYTNTLATFTAISIPKNQPLPVVKLPSFQDQKFLAPVDFEDPFDMKRYPQYFDSDYIDYFFAREEALARGEDNPKRPKTIFSPNPDSRYNAEDNNTILSNNEKAYQENSKSGKGSKKGFSNKWKK